MLQFLSCTIYKENVTKSMQMHNHGQNICRLFHVLAKFPFTKSESELDYYHQKVNIRFASRAAKRPKIYDLSVRNFQEKP